MRRESGVILVFWLALATLGAATRCRAEAVPDSAQAGEVVAAAESSSDEPQAGAVTETRTADGLEALVPELAAHPYRLAPGVRPFLSRLSVSPAFGFFGTERLFALRVAYNPNSWLGYEAGIGHNPGHAVHAVLHTLSVLVRRPCRQPYATGGYGMVIVYPGQSVNADPVTKNTLNIGGGLEFYLRSDLALRAEMRQAVVFGEQRDREGIVAYDYLQGTIGLAFYRSILP